MTSTNQSTTDSETDTENPTDHDDVLWMGFSSEPVHTVVRGPFTSESEAVESVSEYEYYHVEPRVPRDEYDPDQSCVPDDIHPTI